ncbi:MAG: hypothetical protein M1358_01165, partial [Chloroflexi bacterium]|nr:hypothetical protein [Chloroflexota bacterium]
AAPPKLISPLYYTIRHPLARLLILRQARLVALVGVRADPTLDNPNVYQATNTCGYIMSGRFAAQKARCRL